MKKSLSLLGLKLLFFWAQLSFAALEYDTVTNKAQLYGPYIKYNFLKEPYSIGSYELDLLDIRLELDDSQKLTAMWPRYILNYGELKVINRDGRILLSEAMEETELEGDDKYYQYILKDQSQSLQETLGTDFQICIEQIFQESHVKACSDFLKISGGTTQRVQNDSSHITVKINGGKSPKNTQISLGPQQKRVHLKIASKTGFTIDIKDRVRHIKLENLAIDPLEKRIGVIDGLGSVRPTQLTLKDRLFSFIKEKNDFRSQYKNANQWPQDLEDAEMEFSPFAQGAGIQLYGLILTKIPPPFQFKINEDAPIATYRSLVELRGTKAENEVLAARQRNELLIHNNQKEFIWRFPAPKKGGINQNYISLQHKGKDFYFSQRIFRAHSTSLSGALGLSTSPTLDIVPGYNFSAEHWFERIWNNNKYSFQRLGIAANVYETIEGFKPKDDYPEKISINPIHLDMLYRFSSGVRPVQSSFGLGLRYQNFTLFRSINPDISAQLLGVGAFWHTAPQKIVDDIFNIVPFLRYPKWMEVSFFYYPMTFSDVDLGLSFSWQLKGKMFFAKSWFLEASFNVNSVSFKKRTTLGTIDQFGIGTAHGTVGLGYLF